LEITAGIIKEGYRKVKEIKGRVIKDSAFLCKD
jgi:hypothetical protein